MPSSLPRPGRAEGLLERPQQRGVDRFILPVGYAQLRMTPAEVGHGLRKRGEFPSLKDAWSRRDDARDAVRPAASA
jgi:hypothetical protein